MSDLSAGTDNFDDVVQGAEVAAEVLGDATNECDVLADELPGHLDEPRDRTPCGHNVQHPAGGAAVGQRPSTVDSGTPSRSPSRIDSASSPM